MEFVRNSVVKMDWDREGFYEHKEDDCFIAAVNLYGDSNGGIIAVLFKDGKACLLYNEDTETVMTRDEITAYMHELVMAYGSDFSLEDEAYDIYIEVCNGAYCDEDTCAEYGIDEECKQDILERLQDLSGYIVVEVEEPFDSE